MSRVAAGVDVRPYRDADEQAVLGLLNDALGGGPAGTRPAEFFRWKHLENPFGRSFMLVAETDGHIVGLRAFMRWEFVAGDRRFRAVRAVDTATHPDHQGKGIFSRLTLEALDALRDQADFIFNTPNEKSLPGYLKMGWSVVGRVPIRIRVRRPIRFATRARSWRSASELGGVPAVGAAPASELLDEQIDSLLVDRRAAARHRDAAGWDVPALALRRRTAPGLPGADDGRSRSRRRARGLPGPPSRCARGGHGRRDDRATGRPACGAQAPSRASGASARVDHVACSFPPGSSPDMAARRLGSIRAPGGMTLVVNPLGHDLDPDPLDLRSWALTLGDLEVF